MMTESDIFDDFERRWQAASGCWLTACNLTSPNLEDSNLIKMAIVGFSYHDKTENWAVGHYKIAERHLKESEDVGDSEDIRKFNMLVLGSLLGMYSVGKIDERLYGIGYALLPGFVLGKGNGAIG